MMDFLLCISVDKRKVNKDSKFIKNSLSSFYCKLNRVKKVKEEDLLVIKETNDKVFALIDYRDGFVASTDFDPLSMRDRDADGFFELALSNESVTNEDLMMYLCKRLDGLFEDLLCSEKYSNDAITVWGSDSFGTEIEFKYSKTLSKKCSEEQLSYYQKTVKGFKYEVLDESRSSKLYGFLFDFLVIPRVCDTNRFQLWFSFVRKIIDEEETSKLRLVLMEALVEVFNNKSIDLSC